MTISQFGDNRIWPFSRISFSSESPTSEAVPRHYLFRVSIVDGLRDAASQCRLSSYGQLGQVNLFIFSILGFGSGVFSVHTSDIHPHFYKHYELCLESSILHSSHYLIQCFVFTEPLFLQKSCIYRIQQRYFHSLIVLMAHFLRRYISRCSIHQFAVFSSYFSSNFYTDSLITYHLHFHLKAYVTQNLLNSHFTVTIRFCIQLNIGISNTRLLELFAISSKRLGPLANN